jgi:hypothetical protein
VRDLTADRRQELPALSQLRLDVLPLRRALRHDVLLLALRVLKLDAVPLDRGLRGRHLADDVSVLLRRPVQRVDAIDEVVETRGAEQDGERRVLPRGVVGGHEPRRQ